MGLLDRDNMRQSRSPANIDISGDNENINDSIQRFFVEKDSTNGL